MERNTSPNPAFRDVMKRLIADFFAKRNKSFTTARPRAMALYSGSGHYCKLAAEMIACSKCIVARKAAT
jgi:hypothetical protein